MIKQKHKSNYSNGFSIVELLVTLFIASAFLFIGYKLYSLIINDVGDSRSRTLASTSSYEYIQSTKSYATSPCTEQVIHNGSPITIEGLSNVTVSSFISCPYSDNTSISKISVEIRYNEPQKVIRNATFTTPVSNCPEGFIAVPGSETYGTESFCVMKYEAKNENGVPVSKADGLPWTEVDYQYNSLNASQNSNANSPLLTDGNTATSPYFSMPSSSLQSVTVDLGSIKNIDTIKVWHYYGNGRTYYDTKTEISTDNINWTTVFDSAISGTYPETSAGNTIIFNKTQVRYIRDWINGSTSNTGNHWVEIQAFSPSRSVSEISELACDGCHLITEAEWLTIAQNVLSVPSNWSGGAVGSGFIYSGHNDGTPANALSASIDSDGYYGTGNASGSNQKRTLTLTNGEVIWDLAGNVNEWTNQRIFSPTIQPGVTGSGYAWREWPTITNPGTLPENPSPSVTGITGAGTWNSTNGIGQIYSSSDNTSIRGVIRGCSWADGSYAGVLSMILDNIPNRVAHPTIGFRVAK